jgi:hypothetical protein
MRPWAVSAKAAVLMRIKFTAGGRRKYLSGVHNCITLVDVERSLYVGIVMQTFHAERFIEKDGKLHLDHLPFHEGEPVHVFVSSAARMTETALAGSVLKYDQPFSPAAEGDWEAAK